MSVASEEAVIYEHTVEALLKSVKHVVQGDVVPG